MNLQFSRTTETCLAGINHIWMFFLHCGFLGVSTNVQTQWSILDISHNWVISLSLHCESSCESSIFQTNWNLQDRNHTCMFFSPRWVLLRWFFKFQPLKLTWHISHLNVFFYCRRKTHMQVQTWISFSYFQYNLNNLQNSGFPFLSLCWYKYSFACNT